MTDPVASQGFSGSHLASGADGRVARPITPQEVLALMRGVTTEQELADRLRTWRRAATDPTIPRFDLRGALGKGSQGTVWSVADRDFLRPVAIKTMHERDRLPEDVSRFVHEAQITAQLEHPGVVPVHDLQVLPDGTVFYVMKRIEGQTLAELLPEPRIDPPALLDRQRLDLIEIVLKVLDTLAFAHNRGVIHRDLKPKNIMVGRFGEVLVLDWGLAKIVDSGEDTPRHGPAVFSLRSMGEDGGSANATGAGCAVGTPAFMSPEQAMGQSADPRSDVYAIGVILYHVLCGQSPYDLSGGARHVLEQAASGTWVNLEERASARSMPRRLVAIVHKAMALEPRDRYPSAESFAQDLRHFLAGEAVAAYRESPVDRVVRLIGRHQRAVVTGLVVAGLAGAGWSWLEWRQSMQRQQLLTEARNAAAKAELSQDWDTARRHYERIQDLDPADRLAQRAILRVREALGRRAEEDLQRRKQADALVLAQQARQSVADGSDAALLRAQEDYLKALGLTPGDQVLTEEYVRLTNILAAREAERRREQVERENLARNQQRANDHRRESEAAEARGDLAAAIKGLQDAIAIASRPEDTRRLTDLVARQDARSRAAQAAARREAADGHLARIKPLIEAGSGRAAREFLVRAREVLPEHPDLPRVEVLVAKAERVERERSSDETLQIAASNLQIADAERVRAEAADRQCRTLGDQLAEVPTEDLRRRLAKAETERDEARLARAKALADALAELHRARTEAPGYAPANRALAEFYLARLREAEAEGSWDQAAAAEAQARTYDTAGDFRLLLDGQVEVVVPATAPALTLTRLERDDQRRLMPVDGGSRIEPGGSAVLTAGRWLATSTAGTRRALRLQRGDRVEIVLPEVKVPTGTVLLPGTGTAPTVAMMVHEVTCGDYLVFLQDPEVRREMDEARAAGRLIRAPRASYTSTEPLWRTRGSALRSGAGQALETLDGRAIDLTSPVTGISAEDALAYAAWRAKKEGLRWRLPTTHEWRRAVQGGDDRRFPWGDAADLGLCASGPSCADLPKDVLPRVGSFPSDRSVQGVADLAGSVSEFTDGADETVVTAGGVRLIPLMGGSRFDLHPERFAVTHRRDLDPRFVHPGAGFRLVCDP